MAAEADQKQNATREVADRARRRGNSKEETPTPKRSRVPKDFAQRVATKIVAINERELDEEVASQRVSALAHKNMSAPELLSYFVDMTEILIKGEETEKYAATTWAALVWHQDEIPEYKSFYEDVLKVCIQGHRTADRPKYEVEDTGKEFSNYAYIIGEVFIQMMKLNSDLYNILTEFFSFVIRHEMLKDLEKKQEETKKKTLLRKKVTTETIVNTKKLYDDIVDYISQRGEFRSDTLNQKNPNEYILILADRMRSTRRYIIQDIMNKHALEKKRLLEKELREREASAEELIHSSEPFSLGLYFYWVEKRYNFKYLAVEKVRITLQILSITLGLVAIGGGFLGFDALNLIEGMMVCILMITYAKTVCSRYFFAAFYPKDVTADLEKEVSAFTPILRKMSLLQANSFINKQMKSDTNSLLLHLLPEYVRYIFAVMPDRNDILLSKDEINEFMERMELNLTKFQRGK